MHHPPATSSVQPETVVRTPMPRALRILRALCSAMATLSALAALYYVFLLLSVYVYPPPGFGEWLAAQGHSLPELWAMPVLHAFRTVAYTVAAIRLGGGGRTGRTWALVAVGVEAGAIVVGMILGAAEFGIVSVFDAATWMLLALVALALPGLLLLLLSVHSSSEWFRVTAA